MILVVQRHWVAMVSLVVGCLAFGSCFSDSTPQPYGTGFDELAMFVDDCVDEYLVCREECFDGSSGEQQEGKKEGKKHPRVGAVGEPGYPGAGDGAGGLPDGEIHCFYPIGNPNGTPAATAEYVLETYAGSKTVHIRLTFNPAFVDNTYGATAIGWVQKGHKFKDLVGSDHAELELYNKLGVKKVHFKLDYISETSNTPSGYGTLGVVGGDGKMILGDASVVVGAKSSLGRNLNERGYKNYTVDSPLTNANYKPNPLAPDWDFRVVYEAWVKVAAFGAPGFGNGKMAFVHASPSKAANNTLEVEEHDCPSDWLSEEDTDTGSDTQNDTDTGSDTQVDTGTGSDTQVDTGTGSDTQVDTGTGSDTQVDTGTGTGTQGDTDTDTDTTGNDDQIEECLAECETGLDECVEDTRCNETKADDPCVDAFRPCVEICKVEFSVCAEHSSTAECSPGFDECVKGCVTAVDDCAKDVVSIPGQDDDSSCEPSDTDVSVY